MESSRAASGTPIPTGRFEPYPPDGEDGHTVSGTVLRLPNLHSPQLHNERDLYVYLPPDCGLAGRRHPVLYMQDGQNLFDDATSFAGEWHVDESLEEWAGDIAAPIVVGIANAGARRLDEYTPFVDERHGGGDGAAYVEFVVETVKPLVDRTFPTLPQRDSTGIAGSSLGGLISLFAFFVRGETFGRVAALSPSVWFGNREILRFLRGAPRPDGRIYLDTGTAEGWKTVRNARRLRSRLVRKGYAEGRQLTYVEARGAGHGEAEWARRFPAAARFLFGP